ncbi:MAG: glycosyltransferase family 9 protein [Flavobacteriaceae bacterium]|nr:glycosyltransferase family 9 protein [Flavobacteriaceae bacterium]
MKKILVIQNKRIGDVLISSVIANNIKKVFPESEVTYFVYEYTAGVLENNPFIDRVISVKEKELKKLTKLFQTISKIKKEKYDIIFDPYSKFQSRMICLLSGAEYRIGFKRIKKKLRLPFYSHPINYIPRHTMFCGKAIENRLNLVHSVFPIPSPAYEPLIYLTDEEKKYQFPNNENLPVIMLGVLGSTPQKSMPYPYVAEMIDYIAENYKAKILFNYAPNQKEEALKIYGLCKNKAQIDLDIYEDSIRGFIKLMNKCDMLIANEGGSVHIAKALHKPTFTVYSPYIEKEDWSSFEDHIQHESIHLLEEKPNLYTAFTREERKKIEENPSVMYNELTPALIFKKLKPFLAHHLKNAIK